MATGLKDIARELGVSLATVSRALADSPDISAETKERVWAAAEALNYLPNLMARSLRSRRSRVIGVVVQSVATEFGAQAIGTALKAWHKPSGGSWTEIASTTDSVHSTGRISVGGYGTTLRYDNVTLGEPAAPGGGGGGRLMLMGVG